MFYKTFTLPYSTVKPVYFNLNSSIYTLAGVRPCWVKQTRSVSPSVSDSVNCV